jgi:hypothetical protein
VSHSRREEGLILAEELLTDIELARLPAMEVARKTSRLARLLDDADAMQWLGYEIAGYPPGGLDADSTAAAWRSNRIATQGADSASYWTAPLGQLQVEINSATTQLGAQSGAAASNSHFAIVVEQNKAHERAGLREGIAYRQALIDKVIGALHDYASRRYHELRFGSAVETAFEILRREVDGLIGDLVPDAVQMLSGAFDNATSNNPEHWANAASTCRRLLEAAADQLRPPGEDLDGHPMSQSHYVNRLIGWVKEHSTSETVTEMMVADLEFLAHRLDAAKDAGHKGTHERVSRFDASRFITGTYLVLGDILRLGRSDGIGLVDAEGARLETEGEAASISSATGD